MYFLTLKNRRVSKAFPCIRFLCFSIEWYMWRCFDPYGCFYIGSPWSGENRPVSTFPARPDSINPRYMLYTRDNKAEPRELKIDKYETIRGAHLKNDRNLYLIVHGFLDNGDKTWVLVSTRLNRFSSFQVLASLSISPCIHIFRTNERSKCFTLKVKVYLKK